MVPIPNSQYEDDGCDLDSDSGAEPGGDEIEDGAEAEYGEI